MLGMPDILAIWEVIFDWFSKNNVSCIVSVYKIFSIYLFSTVVVQYFTRGEDRDDPFWHTGTGWQLDHSQVGFWLIELQFPFRCSHLSSLTLPGAADQFKISGNWQTEGMKTRNMFTTKKWDLGILHFFHSFQLLLQCQGFSAATICLFFSQ